MRFLMVSVGASTAGEAGSSPPGGTVSTVLLLVPSPGAVRPDQDAAQAAEFLPAVTALLHGLAVPATVVPDEQVLSTAAAVELLTQLVDATKKAAVR